MFSKNKTGAGKDSGIIFVRRYPFYCSTQAQNKKYKLNFHVVSYSFQVTISTMTPLHKSTGMTVNLLKLDQAAKKNLKAKPVLKRNLSFVLENIYKLLDKELRLKKIKLVSLQFDECRGLSVKFQGLERFSIRHDYARDESGDLFKISSQFNRKNDLVELEIKNLKLDLQERIIF